MEWRSKSDTWRNYRWSCGVYAEPCTAIVLNHDKTLIERTRWYWVLVGEITPPSMGRLWIMHFVFTLLRTCAWSHPASRHRFRAVFSLTFLYPVNSQRLIHQYDKWTYFPPPSPALSLGIGLRQPLYTSWAVTKQAYRSLRLPVQITPWIEEYVEQAVNQRRARERAVEWERYSRSILSLATSSGSTINPIVLPVALHCSDVWTDVWDPWALEYSAQNKTIDQW